MLFSGLELARRLERAEGTACLQFAKTRRRLFPSCDAEWREYAGAYAVFDGVASPVTQSFGLGVFEELRPESLDVIERFFVDRGAPVLHEVSPYAGRAALDLLCARNYRPVEINNVLYRAVGKPEDKDRPPIKVWKIEEAEAQIWNEVSAKGWSHEHPELLDFVLQGAAICSARAQSPCFLAAWDGTPGAAGVLCIDEGVALFGGASTIPELRSRGLQSALLHERMRYAFSIGCDLAMMVAEAGSNSQRNAERQGFQIAYTRMKWRLFPSD